MEGVIYSAERMVTGLLGIPQNASAFPKGSGSIPFSFFYLLFFSAVSGCRSSFSRTSLTFFTGKI